MNRPWFPSGEKPRRPPKVPVCDYPSIKAALEEGATLASIARQYDVGAGWIRHLAKLNGWAWRGLKPKKASKVALEPPRPKLLARPPEQHKGWPKPFRERPTAESRISQIVERVKADPEYVAEQRKYLGSSISEGQRKYMLTRRRKDPAFKLRMNLRSRVYRLLRKKSKSAYTQRLLGCSLGELMAHLESQFAENMNWDNYGTFWHVDHIIPLASFDLTKPEHLRTACHWTNLQPLSAEENLQKKHKVSEEIAADVKNYVFLVNNVL
jgi:transposase-like protein